jgi:hypothetical protein
VSRPAQRSWVSLLTHRPAEPPAGFSPDSVSYGQTLSQGSSQPQRFRQLQRHYLAVRVRVLLPDHDWDYGQIMPLLPENRLFRNPGSLLVSTY